MSSDERRRLTMSSLPQPMTILAKSQSSRTAGKLLRFALRIILSLVLFPALHAWCQVAVRVPDETLSVQDISLVNGSVWLATTKGAYRVAGNSATPLQIKELTAMPEPKVPFPDSLEVKKIASAGNALWLATSSGAYRIQGQLVSRVPDQLLEVNSLAVTADSKVWLATFEGAFLLNGQNAVSLGPKDDDVRDVVLIGDSIWIITDRGAYRANPDGSLKQITPAPVHVNDITAARGSVWIATEKGALRVTNDGHVDVVRPDLNVLRVSEAKGDAWLASQTGAFRVHGTGADRVPNVEMVVEDVAAIDGEIWLATNRGAFRIKDDSPTPSLSLELAHRTKSIRKFNDGIWFSTFDGAFLLKDGRFSRVPNVDSEIQEIKVLNNDLWIASTKGAFRVSDVGIRINLANSDSIWKKLIDKVSPWPIYVAGEVSVTADYVAADGTSSSSPDLADPRFQAVLKTLGPGQSCPTISENEYSGVPEKGTSYIAKLELGRSRLCIGVKDRSGNTAQQEMDVWALPGPGIVAVITGAFWLSALATLIALAPFNSFVNDILMNPWLRNIGSFGLIPLAVTSFPSIRRHMLKRYVKNLEGDRVFVETARTYQVPDEKFEPPQFRKRLADERVLLITGRSGIGKTSYLRLLTATSTTQGRTPSDSTGSHPGNGHSDLASSSENIPVFIPLGRYQGQRVEDMVGAQLDSYGGLKDKQIVSWYVNQGGFLYLIDGLNEVDEATRNNVNRFIDEGRRKNEFCVSSQESYPGFAWITEVRLAYLSPDNIRKIIRARLSDRKASETLAQFSQRTFAEYKLPQDVEFLLQTLSDSNSSAVPQSKAELYESVLSPVFAVWREEGRADFPDLLAARAYSMLVTRDPHLNGTNVQLAEELTAPLIVRKLITQRDTGIYFQHNLIRDYLASLYLQPRWRQVLADNGLSIDSNWFEALRFVLATFTQLQVCKEFLYAVFEKNRTLAGELFTWLDSSQPGLTAEWSGAFKVKIAEAVLDSR